MSDIESPRTTVDAAPAQAPAEESWLSMILRRFAFSNLGDNYLALQAYRYSPERQHARQMAGEQATGAMAVEAESEQIEERALDAS